MATSYPISVEYGVAGDHWASGHHTGIDIAAPSGTALYSPVAGQVLIAGPHSKYGNYVVIQGQDGRQYLFAHLSGFSVQPGMNVTPGTILGATGATGNVTGPHLHFEVKENGKAIDPTPFLDQNSLWTGQAGAKAPKTKAKLTPQPNSDDLLKQAAFTLAGVVGMMTGADVGPLAVMLTNIGQGMRAQGAVQTPEQAAAGMEATAKAEQPESVEVAAEGESEPPEGGVEMDPMEQDYDDGGLSQGFMMAHEDSRREAFG